jgi:hypothetical protein
MGNHARGAEPLYREYINALWESSEAVQASDAIAEPHYRRAR